MVHNDTEKLNKILTELEGWDEILKDVELPPSVDTPEP